MIIGVIPGMALLYLGKFGELTVVNFEQSQCSLGTLALQLLGGFERDTQFELLSDQSEEKAEIKTNVESDYESEYSIYFPKESDPELDYGSESVYHYR